MPDDDLELRMRRYAETSSGIRATDHLRYLLDDLDRREPAAVAADRSRFGFVAPGRWPFASRLAASAAAIGIIAAVVFGPLLLAGPKTGRETPAPGTPSDTPSPTPAALLEPFAFEQLGLRLGWVAGAAYGDHGYVILTGAAPDVSSGDEAVYRSQNGFTWERSAAFWPHGEKVEELVSAAGGYVALTATGDGSGVLDRSVWTSTDGSAWRKTLTLPEAVGPQLLSFRNRPLLLASDVMGNSTIWSTGDLIEWSMVASLPPRSQKLTVVGDRVIAMSGLAVVGGNAIPMFVSADGLQWSQARSDGRVPAGTYDVTPPARWATGWMIQLREHVATPEQMMRSFTPFHLYELTSNDLVTWQSLDDWAVNGWGQMPDDSPFAQPGPIVQIDGVDVTVQPDHTWDTRTTGERGTGPENVGASISQSLDGTQWYGLQDVVASWDNRNLVTVEPYRKLAVGPHAVVLALNFVEWRGGDRNNLSYYSDLWVAPR